MTNLEKDVLALEKSGPVNDSYVNSVSILLRILDNIIKEPQNEKYRSIRLENKIIKEQLLCLNGVRELLGKIGFFEVDGSLKLPTNILLATIRKYRDHLAERLEYAKNGSKAHPHNIPGPSSGPKKPATSGSKKPKIRRIIPLKPYRERIKFDKIIVSNNPFLQEIEDMSDRVQQYEDDRLQYYGRRLIPLEMLTDNAIKSMRAVQKQQLQKGNAVKDPCFDDWLLVELAKWFNEKFFSWVNTLPCKICNKTDSQQKHSLIEDNVRVEVLTCCNTQTKFHRYNDIAKLLCTRKGRCGEYANCFTFFCRCLGYEARFVLATFDHVWTEVFSVAQNRWLHIDPSDNVVDAPLMYQHGWKRSVDYIFAYSHDDIQDVTWRYGNNHAEIRSRRRKCTETELLKTILQLRAKRQQNSGNFRKRYLCRRNLMEIVELLTERSPTENEKKGRSSGDLSWRTARGEDQLCSNNFFVFNASDTEVSAKQFNVRYSAVTDQYERYTYNAGAVSIVTSAKTWQTCALRWTNIFRKEERDWKMVYLARAEDTDNAEIEWKFDFSQQNLKIKTATLKFDTKVYENAKIQLEIMHNGHKLANIQSVHDLDSFSVCAKLSGGKGDVAWQHTQLFRQSTDSKDEYPFQLELTFY